MAQANEILEETETLETPQETSHEDVSSHKRIAKNTIYLYFRMLITMVVGLFTSRVVLNTLGVEDYGLYNLVGGVVGLMGIITSLLSQGTSRFITIALGKNNLYELKSTFSASLTIHICLAIFILIIGEVIGPRIISNLNIESLRMDAAQFVFQISLISAVTGIIISPFIAIIVAHEKFSLYAYISIFDVIAKLGIVYLLLLVNIDKLKLYSLLYFSTNLITTLIYILYCYNNFIECKKIQLKVDRKLYESILNYTGWNAIGACAFTLNGQGLTILLSIFGTAVNAARGIAGNISTYCYSFVANFQSASRPQITKLCAIGDFTSMNNLIVRTSKISTYLIGFIGIPLFIEMEYILALWLKIVPDYTVVFARLTLVQGFIQSMDFPIGAGIHAVGKMKLPNLTSAFIYMAILPICYIIIKIGATPELAYIVIVCVYPIAMFMDLYIINKYTQFPVWNFIKNVIIKSSIFIVFTYIVVRIIITNYFEPNFIRLLFSTISSCLIFTLIVYGIGLTSTERLIVKKTILAKIHKK